MAHGPDASINFRRSDAVNDIAEWRKLKARIPLLNNSAYLKYYFKNIGWIGLAIQDQVFADLGGHDKMIMRLQI